MTFLVWENEITYILIGTISKNYYIGEVITNTSLKKT